MNTKFLSLAMLVMCAPVSADASFAYWNPWSSKSQPESSTIVNTVVETAKETAEQAADVVADTASAVTDVAKRSVDTVSEVISTDEVKEEAAGRVARAFACIKAAPQAAWSATKTGVHAVVTSPVNFASWAQKFYWTEATGFQRSYRLTLTAALATAISYGSYKAYEKYNTEKAA